MVQPVGRALNPKHWMNNLAAWWLGIDMDTVRRHKLDRQREKEEAQVLIL